MRYVVMAILMTLTCLDLRMAQAADPFQREGLRGLPGVEVNIEKIASDAQADGLSQEAIRTAVELILRSSGVRVLTTSETSPVLYVRVSTHKHSSALYAYAVTVWLLLNVSSVQRPEQPMIVVTWEADSGAVGTIGKDKLRQIIDIVQDQVREFTNDFLAVNPR